MFLTYEGGMTSDEAESARQEVNALLAMTRWSRVVLDVTQLQSIPTAMELFEFSEGLFLGLPRSARIALVVRPDQIRHAGIVENIARNSGVTLTYFTDAEEATAWVNLVKSFAAPPQATSLKGRRNYQFKTPLKTKR